MTVLVGYYKPALNQVRSLSNIENKGVLCILKWCLVSSTISASSIVNHSDCKQQPRITAEIYYQGLCSCTIKHTRGTNNVDF